jgi:hypothetical protein
MNTRTSKTRTLKRGTLASGAMWLTQAEITRLMMREAIRLLARRDVNAEYGIVNPPLDRTCVIERAVMREEALAH